MRNSLRVAWLLVTLLQPDLARAEVVQDTVSVLTSTFDFADQDCGCPPCILSCRYPEHVSFYDINLIYIFDPPLGHALLANFGIVALGPVPIDSVLTAPVGGYVDAIAANINEEFQANHTYVLRTRSGGHAVIVPLIVNELGGGFTFIYKYQSDGTGNFEPNHVGSFAKPQTVQTTWSRIKARY